MRENWIVIKNLGLVLHLDPWTWSPFKIILQVASSWIWIWIWALHTKILMILSTTIWWLFVFWLCFACLAVLGWAPDKRKQTSLLCMLQAQTLPDPTPPIGNTRRYGQLCGPTSSSCRELQLLEPENCRENYWRPRLKSKSRIRSRVSAISWHTFSQSWY